VLVMLWLTRLLDLPPDPLCAGSLLQQQFWPLAIALTWLVLIAGAALTGIFASTEHYEGGLFCASIGIALLSVRFGSMRYALFAATGPRIYLSLAIELVVIYVAVLIAWMMLFSVSRSGWLPAERANEKPEPLDQKLLATAMHAVVMIVVMLLLCRSDAKAQTLASVGIAAYLASLAAYQFIPAEPSGWILLSPMIVGLVGYISQYFTQWDWMIGDARGYFAALSRPLPLDYASLGVAGTLLGYWTSQRWRHNAAESSE
ncbi:MAG TPA: hypothetical protein VKK61_01225, partial [Tepidisphaeraceae bacterium]|nr:hypothetical protein [Tepidisphaeraceae bacterium]